MGAGGGLSIWTADWGCGEFCTFVHWGFAREVKVKLVPIYKSLSAASPLTVTVKWFSFLPGRSYCSKQLHPQNKLLCAVFFFFKNYYKRFSGAILLQIVSYLCSQHRNPTYPMCDPRGNGWGKKKKKSRVRTFGLFRLRWRAKWSLKSFILTVPSVLTLYVLWAVHEKASVLMRRACRGRGQHVTEVKTRKPGRWDKVFEFYPN